MEDYYLIAEIKSSFEDQGFVSVISFSDHPQRFYSLKKVYIDIFGDKKEFLIEKVKEFKGNYILKFKNFNSEKDISILLGKQIFVDSKNLIKLPKDTFFIHDLVGSKVIYNEKIFGTIADVLQLPANDVYVIKTESGEEVLIPAIKDYVKSFDPLKKELVLIPKDDLFLNDED